MNQEIHPAPWKPYADEAAHYSYVRCLSMGHLYEVVRVTHEKNGRTAEFLHQVIFMKEYCEEEIAEILKGFGYNSMGDFAHETGCIGAALLQGASQRSNQDGSVDHMIVASLMAEHFTGRQMDVQSADRLASCIVNGQSTGDSFCIRRSLFDQEVTIPLTNAEVDAIYSAKASQAQVDCLCDEICDLDEDAPCFEGHTKEELLDNSRFLDAVQARWSRYNGNGGNATENLQEAITVTIHELFPE